MWRYLRLYGYFLEFSFSKALQFRFDFFFRVFMDLLYYAVNILLYRVLFLHTDLLAGWREDQALFFVAMYLIVDAVHMCVVANNCWWFPITINRGELDYYLIRPVSSLFFLSFREFAANSFINLLVSIGILVWAISNYQGTFTAAHYGLMVLFIILGATLYWLTHLVFLIPVFWTQSARGFGNVFFTFTKLLERPDRIFIGPVRIVLTTVLPFCLMASVPARMIMEEFDWTTFGHLLLVLVGMFGLVQLLWRLGLRSYTSASS